MNLSTQKIQTLLKTTDLQKLNQLFSDADSIRKKNVGDAIHLRGLLEISNYCGRKCHYCGLRHQNSNLTRYRMSLKEILECAILTKKFNYGTIVLQSGEDLDISQQAVESIIKSIKQNTDLAITLSLGERSLKELQTWKNAGADRYLLRFETSDVELYRKIHPSKDSSQLSHPSDRINLLRSMRQIGYEIGSGVMIGIPGQTFDRLTEDLLLFHALDLDMIGVGPYILNPDTPLGQKYPSFQHPPLQYHLVNQVPNTELMTYKVMALTRLLCCDANIPSATALASLNKAYGRELGLQRGANVVMPNVTPTKYRKKYMLYPGKACTNETAGQCQKCMHRRIASIGRRIGYGPGSRLKN
jgi:biotin synthase